MKHLLSNQTRIFIAVVETGSVTAAAYRLEMGKSGVSDALKQLESMLGAQLLMRTTRRQSLTAIGETFYCRCKSMHDLATVALEEVNEYLAEPSGPIRITAPHAIIDFAVAPALAALVERYPKVEPDVLVDDKRIDLIKHQISLALTVGEMPDSEFKSRRIGYVQDVLCASPALIKKFNLDLKSRSIEKSIQTLPYVANHWEGAEPTTCLTHLDTGKSMQFRFRRVASVNSVDAALSLIVNGLGFGALPNFILGDRLKSRELVAVLPEYESRKSALYAVHPYGSVPPLSVRILVEELQKILNATN